MTRPLEHRAALAAYDIDRELDLTPDAVPSDPLVKSFCETRDRLLADLFDPIDHDDEEEEPDDEDR